MNKRKISLLVLVMVILMGCAYSAPVFAAINPYVTYEAEKYSDQQGVQTEPCSEGGENVGYIENGDWIKYASVDFGDGANRFDVRLSSATEGGNIELHLDNPTGTMIGNLSFTGTGDWQIWETVSCPVYGAKGVHDLYLIFTGDSGDYLFNINWWKFNSGEAIPTIWFNKTVAKLKQGAYDKLTATIVPDGDANISFKSSNSAVAEIVESIYDKDTKTATATIIGKSEGTTTIVAEAGDGVVSAECKVVVSGRAYAVLNPIKDTVLGAEVNISGSSILDETCIKVISPDKTIMFFDTVHGKEFSETIKLPIDAVTGRYTVIAGKNQSVTTAEFEVKEQISHGVFSNDADGMSEITELTKGQQIYRVETVKNTDSADLKCILVLAQYSSDGVLKSVASTTNTIAPGETAELKLQSKVIEHGDYIKSFLWNDIGEMKPLAKAAVIE